MAHDKQNSVVSRFHAQESLANNFVAKFSLLFSIGVAARTTVCLLAVFWFQLCRSRFCALSRPQIPFACMSCLLFNYLLSVVMSFLPVPSFRGLGWLAVAVQVGCRRLQLQRGVHITIWLDIKGAKAAGYVAISRVEYDENYLLGGVLKRRHFVPAM